MQSSGQMMNTSAFNPNSVHQGPNIVTVTHAPPTHQHPTHAPPMTATSGPLSYHLHAQAAPLHMPQAPMPTVMDGADSASVGSAHSTTPIFDPRQLSVANSLEKTYYTAAGAVTTTPATAGSARFYTTAAATDANATAATQQHHHQHANTILITNNFATQQQFTAAPPIQSTLPQRTPPTIANIPNISSAGGTHFGSNGSNIRIVTTLPSSLQQNGATQTHQQHAYNVDKEIQQQHTDALQLQQQQLYQQQHQHQYATHAPHLSALLPQHFVPQHFATTQPATPQQHATAAMQLQLPPTAQQYYLPAAATDTSVVAAGNGATKMLSALPTLSGTADEVGSNTLGMTQATTAGATGTSAPPVATAATSSTVVLDRINICINNHYSDSMASSSSSSAASSSIDTATMATNAHAQQPSPIIPAIHHKAVLDTGGGGLHIDAYASNDSTLVIDEPDSTTTTPHTPPTTPENSTPPLVVANTTTTTTQTSPSSNKEAQAAATTTGSAIINTRHAFAAIAQCIELEDDDDDEVEEQIINPKQSADHAQSVAQIEQCAATAEATTVAPSTVATTAPTVSPPASAAAGTATAPMTSPTPTTPPAPVTPTLSFVVGEDVFMRRDDGRFYLGTVIDSEVLSASLPQLEERQYLVQFDDKSELWCRVDEMRKLGGGAGTNVTGSSNGSTAGQMCVACKRAQQQDVVETCERCGRGYHRNCTSETSPGSGVWWCKRCNKAMKMLPNSNNNSVCRQLPYHVDALKWDEKHRVNEEQIYCYCGKTGQFDNNMLQCCKCQNWFHTQCMHNFEHTLLRGDGFFVFCCSICNDGEEFVRRLQMSWIDLLHLTLYNLSVMKKHHKFHHLTNDIWPFIVEKRNTLPLPKEWIEMSRTDLLKNITVALKEHSERFICGRECKRDLCYYALRNNGPPILPKIQVRADDVLSDELLTHTLKLILMPQTVATENDQQLQTSLKTANFPEMGAFKSKSVNDAATGAKTDVYEFRIEDDEKFTSDDEIPIKHIIEKVRKSKGTPPSEKHSNSVKFKIKKHSPATANAYEKIELNDENANDANGSLSIASKRSPTKTHSESKQQTPKKECGSTLTKSNNSSNGEKQAEQLPTLAHAANSSGITTAAVIPEKSSRKRKAFTLSKTYKEIAAEAAAKRYDSSRICDSSSDENSSSSRGTSLDVIIPPPKNFLGPNNPFRMVTPKKGGQCTIQSVAVSGVQKTLNFSRSGTVIKSSIFNTTTLDFSSKLAALKNAGMFPNLSTSNLAKAASQPRTVRTIKRRLSAKDITIGPNQEVRRRRTRRPSANVEVISTTTIHPIPSNFFPIHAKDLLSTTTTHTFKQQQQPAPPINTQHVGSCTSSSAPSSSPASVTSSLDSQPELLSNKPTHGRRLRQRPQKSSPGNSRRSSISSASTSSNSSSNVALATLQQAASNNTNANNGSNIMQDLKQTVKEYFGAVNRIESGEQFSIRAKRQLSNGQTQYLVEWGDANATVPPAAAQTLT